MNESLPARAQTVIIGGGVIGTALAYRLAELSHTDVVLLERGQLGCGTSWHAGLVGEYMIEELAGIPVSVEYASEWRYRDPVLDSDTVVIGVSQSGETADTLAAIDLANERGCLTLGVVNVVGSSVARRTEAGVYLHAGPEIGVASTKAFTSQVVALSLIAIYLGRLKGLAPDEAQPLLAELESLPAKVEAVLEGADEIEEMAERLIGYPNFDVFGIPFQLFGQLIHRLHSRFLHG